MERPWLKNYPPGVPAEIHVPPDQTLVDMLTASVRRFGSRTAFISMGRALSYDDFDELTAAFGAYLLNSAGLQPGERFAVMLPNLLQQPVAVFGALRAGLTVVNVNPLYTPRELRGQLQDSGAAGIVVLENFAHGLAEVLADTSVRAIVVSRVGDLLGFPRAVVANFVVRHVRRQVPSYHLPHAVPLPGALEQGAGHGAPSATVRPGDIAFLQYTGGTTGIPKAAMLSHRNLMANLEQIRTWLQPVMGEDGETIITALPLYHVFALTANCLTFLRLGGCNHLIANPRNLDRLVGELQSCNFTGITGVNTLFNAMMHHPHIGKVDFSHLKMSLGGGAALLESVAGRWKTLTGSPLIEAYGLTEASPAVIMNPMTLREYNGKIGLPISSTDCEIRNDSGDALDPGEIGELCIRGPQVMQGYWRQPAETKKVLDAKGWLHSGDVAVMDEDGYFKLVDRKKDLILVSGFNVYPNEIEAVIAGHPGVLEAAAVGIPDERSGEAVRLFVVRKDPLLAERDLLAFCKERLAAYKIPRHIHFLDSLPKSAVGKVLRSELRQRDTGPPA